MNGNYNKSYDGHFFRNTVIENARNIHTNKLSTSDITAGKPSEIINVNSKIQFNDDLTIIKDGEEIKLGDIFTKLERIERYLKYLDDGLLISTFDDFGNNIPVKY